MKNSKRLKTRKTSNSSEKNEDIMKYAGTLSKEEGEIILKEIEKERKRSSRRML